MDLGPHAVFIWASYAAVAVTVAGLIAWLVADGARQRSALDDLESRGIRRHGQASMGQASMGKASNDGQAT